MSKSVLEMMENVTVVELLVALTLLSAIAAIVISQKNKIVKLLNKWRKTKNEEEDFHQLVYDLKATVEDLKESVNTYSENRIHDREDSRRIQKEIYKAIGNQADGIAELKKITLEIQQKNSKTKRAEIKEKIERLYRECSPTKTCTDMAYDTLRDLIEEYEEHGGKNSFVHSVVEPEMVTWHRVAVVHATEDEA